MSASDHQSCPPLFDASTKDVNVRWQPFFEVSNLVDWKELKLAIDSKDERGLKFCGVQLTNNRQAISDALNLDSARSWDSQKKGEIFSPALPWDRTLVPIGDALTKFGIARVDPGGLDGIVGTVINGLCDLSNASFEFDPGKEEPPAATTKKALEEGGGKIMTQATARMGSRSGIWIESKEPKTLQMNCGFNAIQSFNT
ncbi:hypothetical protein BCR34DRAFT_392829 [Clohesyomyces aquaticus]|uniref:Uncharacterized protein n=1 Tax=Clohesyomyces aquaticus TaxID=1231657 RepID=A0A1Y1ZEC7_9PLEO|nr:hypothetical protein BCR34DRAFT_392829 [Clohesyomyces aquaticus]